MTIDEFEKTLKDFLSQTLPSDKEVVSTEFVIEMQPGLVSFGGHFTLLKGDQIPIDIRQIEKKRCEQLSSDIQSLHHSTTDHGRSKWNKAAFNVNSVGHVERQFTWDVEFEDAEKSSFRQRTTRQKWYWEEDNHS